MIISDLVRESTWGGVHILDSLLFLLGQAELILDLTIGSYTLFAIIFIISLFNIIFEKLMELRP